MRTRMRSDERRASIVAEAVRLFAENGFRGTTTRRLAGSLKITEPVLYQHFATKEELYRAIIEEKATSTVEGRERLTELAHGSDDRVFFAYLGEMILEKFESDPAFMRLLLYSALERHELADLFFENHIQDFYALVSGYIERRIREGAMRTVDPMAAARGFIGMIGYHGEVNMLFGNKLPKFDRHKLVEDLVSIFLKGITR